MPKRIDLVLQLIPDGYNWLKWAISQKEKEYYFENEDQLIISVLEGLNSTKYVLFEDFKIGINKLLSFSTEVIQDLLDGKDQVKAAKENGIVTFEQLKKVQEYLNKSGISNDSIFKGMSFEDQIRLYNFMSETETVESEINKEAIIFALNKSNTVSQYIAFCQFYIEICKNQLKKDAGPPLRTKKTNEVYEMLYSIVFSLIETPVIGAGVSNQMLKESLAIIIETLPESTVIGYNSVADAMCNLVKNIKDIGLDESSLSNEIGSYLNAVKIAAGDSDYALPKVSQSGLIRSFTLSHKDGTISLAIDEKRCLLLLPDTLLAYSKPD